MTGRPVRAAFGEYEDSGSDITISFKEYQSFYF